MCLWALLVLSYLFHWFHCQVQVTVCKTRGYYVKHLAHWKASKTTWESQSSQTGVFSNARDFKILPCCGMKKNEAIAMVKLAN